MVLDDDIIADIDDDKFITKSPIAFKISTSVFSPLRFAKSEV